MERELIQKISNTNQALKSLKDAEQAELMKTQFSTEVLLMESIKKICAAYYKEDNKWYGARITNVNEPAQTCEIIWLVNKEKATLPGKYIKVQKTPEINELTSGIFCEAIYMDDGRWYPCCIERAVEDGYQIKFKKYGTIALVPREYIRINKDKGIKREYEEMTSFKAPEHLKIRPTDTPETKKQKKRKIKAIKQHIKTKALDKEAKERQNVWHNFNSDGAKSKKGYYALKKAESIFKSPDTVEGKVGVTGSGKGMTALTQKPKVTEKNPHKSRIF